jgi:cysteine-rich repeat protein
MNHMNVFKRLRLVFSVLAIMSMISPAAWNYSAATMANFGLPARAQEVVSDTNEDIGAIKDDVKDTTPAAPADLAPEAVVPSFITIGGMKWNDINGNGQMDAGEPGLADVTITITEVAVDTVASDVSGIYSDSVVNDTNGHYSFSEVPNDATYDICEQVPTGWHQTYPTDKGTNNCHRFSTWSINEQTGYNFGNQQDAFCGDAIKNDNEQCDDGNEINHDGCDTSCHLEHEVMCREDQSHGSLSFLIASPQKASCWLPKL